MRCNRSSDMKKCLTIKLITLLAIFFQQVLFATAGKAQTGESTVDALVEMGFENVGWMEDADERVYVLQNSAYRLQGVGIGKAVDVIQKMGLPVDKPCRIIVLDNGRVAEQGTHDDLMHADGLYARLWRMQESTAGWKL